MNKKTHKQRDKPHYHNINHLKINRNENPMYDNWKKKCWSNESESDGRTQKVLDIMLRIIGFDM